VCPRDFVINAQNTGVYSAYNVTLLDRLPNGPTGGMCDTTPQVLSARVFAADGTTPVAGKGPLVQGTDYSLGFDGVACELTLRTLTAASVVGVGERLIIAYRTQLDADTQNGITLTNVAGATEWYNDFGSNPGRTGYTRTLTDGTVGTYDHEDAYTVNVMPRRTPKRPRRCSLTACRRASSIRATCCATRSGFTTTACCHSRRPCCGGPGAAEQRPMSPTR
jgi:hypothetical protein